MRNFSCCLAVFRCPSQPRAVSCCRASGVKQAAMHCPGVPAGCPKMPIPTSQWQKGKRSSSSQKSARMNSQKAAGAGRRGPQFPVSQGHLPGAHPLRSCQEIPGSAVGRGSTGWGWIPGSFLQMLPDKAGEDSFWEQGANTARESRAGFHGRINLFPDFISSIPCHCHNEARWF